MPVIAVVNRKGGSGKSTLATHLAAYLANAGHAVMLGDVDQQQSTLSWLRLRKANTDAVRSPILGWTVEPARGLRPPVGTTHVVLDTPGGLTGFELARVVMFADAILLPVCNSVFDRDSAAQCLAELRTLPRIASGRCKLAAVGMRVDAQRNATRRLRTWCEGLDLPLASVLRDTPAYVRCIEQGLTIFDMPARHMQADLQQWEPILRWLAPVLCLGPVPATAAAPAMPRPMPGPMPAPAAPAAPATSATSAIELKSPGLGNFMRGLFDLRPKPGRSQGSAPF